MELYNLEFSAEAVREAAAAGRLLSMEIEFSRRCNFRCVYCYVENRVAGENELSPEESRNVIVQARELGARKIIILGGEPSIDPNLPAMLRFIAGLGLDIEIFTNGSGISRELAALLAAGRARVALKLNSRNPELQDRLAGKKGAAAVIGQALANLREAGYPRNGLFLALSTVICRQNLVELPELWRWMRGQNIEPYFEVITPQGHAREQHGLAVSGPELKELFERLAQIDREEFGRIWEPQPPLAGNRCMRHLVSCLVTATGEVMPCVGVTLSQGNIRERRLADILHESPVIRDLKNYRQSIKGPCRSCEKAGECYGCRGAAYQLTGDYLASDPTCWRNCPDGAEPACIAGPTDPT